MQGRTGHNGDSKSESTGQQPAGGFDYHTFQQSANEWQGLENWPASSDGQATNGQGDAGEFAPLDALVQPHYGEGANEHIGAGPSEWTTLGGAEGQAGDDAGQGDDGEYLPEGDSQNMEGATPRATPRGKKLALACHFCRKRKLKCDGVQPVCENCRKRNQTCDWDSFIRRRGPGRRTKEQRERSKRETDAAGLVIGDVSEGDIAATAEALAQVQDTDLSHNTLADSLDNPQKRRKGEDGIGVGVGVGLGGNGGYSLHAHHHLAGPEEIPDLNDASFDQDLESLEALQNLDGLHAIRELSAQDLGAVVGQVVQDHAAQQAAAGAHDDDPTIDPALKG